MSHSTVTPGTVVSQDPLSNRILQEREWSELPFPSLADLRNPGIKPTTPDWGVDSFNTEPPVTLLNQ